MTDTAAPTLSNQADILRRKVEEKAGLVMQQLEARAPEETQKVLYELRVHQIELEMQNEELRAAQTKLDASLARYWELYDFAPVGCCTLSVTGVILETNRTAAIGARRAASLRPYASAPEERTKRHDTPGRRRRAGARCGQSKAFASKREHLWTIKTATVIKPNKPLSARLLSRAVSSISVACFTVKLKNTMKSAYTLRGDCNDRR